MRPGRFQVYNNHVRPHLGLDGKTSGEAAGIRIGVPNKWKTMIQTTVKTQDRRD